MRTPSPAVTHPVCCRLPLSSMSKKVCDPSTEAGLDGATAQIEDDRIHSAIRRASNARSEGRRTGPISIGVAVKAVHVSRRVVAVGLRDGMVGMGICFGVIPLGDRLTS